MTGPHGELSRGGWEFLTIDPQRSFEILDGFVDADGALVDGMPLMRVLVRFAPIATGTRIETITYFASVESLEQALAMGAVEGTVSAMSQLDAVLQDLRAYAEGKGTILDLLDDTHVRITRLVRGPRALVWRAYTEPELVRQWMLGPEGWEMTECVVSAEPGAPYRASWAPVGETEGEPFGFEGENLLVDPPRRAVTTERMQGTAGPQTINDLTLYEEDGYTLVTCIIEYPDKETRDMILATGMVDGMESSYARLERVVLQG